MQTLEYATNAMHVSDENMQHLEYAAFRCIVSENAMIVSVGRVWANNIQCMQLDVKD